VPARRRTKGRLPLRGDGERGEERPRAGLSRLPRRSTEKDTAMPTLAHLTTPQLRPPQQRTPRPRPAPPTHPWRRTGRERRRCSRSPSSCRPSPPPPALWALSQHHSRAMCPKLLARLERTRREQRARRRLPRPSRRLFAKRLGSSLCSFARLRARTGPEEVGALQASWAALPPSARPPPSGRPGRPVTSHSLHKREDHGWPSILGVRCASRGSCAAVGDRQRRVFSRPSGPPRALGPHPLAPLPPPRSLSFSSASDVSIRRACERPARARATTRQVSLVLVGAHVRGTPACRCARATRLWTPSSPSRRRATFHDHPRGSPTAHRALTPSLPPPPSPYSKSGSTRLSSSWRMSPRTSRGRRCKTALPAEAEAT